jgi:hypothetical protein
VTSDESNQLDDSLDLVQITACSMAHGRHQIQPNQTGSGFGIFNRDIFSNSSGN